MSEGPRLSDGQRSTIAVWRALAVDMWGVDCPAVDFLDMVIRLVGNPDQAVYLPESSVFSMLRIINERTGTT